MDLRTKKRLQAVEKSLSNRRSDTLADYEARKAEYSIWQMESILFVGGRRTVHPGPKPDFVEDPVFEQLISRNFGRF